MAAIELTLGGYPIGFDLAGELGDLTFDKVSVWPISNLRPEIVGGSLTLTSGDWELDISLSLDEVQATANRLTALLRLARRINNKKNRSFK